MTAPEELDVSAALSAVADASPLVTCVTNSVTVNDVANVVRHWDGLPVMSEDRREVADMVGTASACLLNMGTVDETGEETMLVAGRAANRRDLPVVFDPVGVGATPTRTRIARRVLSDMDVAIVKGNHAEVSTLAGDEADVRGVESVGEYTEIAETAIACARETGAVVVASGEIDVVADAARAYEISVGDAMMGQYVGTGCMLGGSLATFAGGLGLDRSFAAALAGTTAFGLAGERAVDDEWNGPASYRTAFLDSVAGMAAENVDPDEAASRIDLVATA